MALPFIPFKSVLKKITKLAGKPVSNIKKWCYVKNKVITPNPVKPSKKKTVKEENLDIPSLQELLIKIVDKVNDLVDTIDKIPEIERQIWELENQFRELSNEFEEHRNAVRRTSSGTRPVHQYFSNTSQQTTMESGGRTGRTKPKPLSQSQRKQLIDDILKGS
tara:strand:+ start:1634 stop:2122 length:489 start_codon:yes stop_codon:yes gene_type:complete